MITGATIPTVLAGVQPENWRAPAQEPVFRYPLPGVECMCGPGGPVAWVFSSSVDCYFELFLVSPRNHDVRFISTDGAVVKVLRTVFCSMSGCRLKCTRFWFASLCTWNSPTFYVPLVSGNHAFRVWAAPGVHDNLGLLGDGVTSCRRHERFPGSTSKPFSTVNATDTSVHGGTPGEFHKIST